MVVLESCNTILLHKMDIWEFFIATNFSVLKKKTTRSNSYYENNEVQGTVKQFQFYVIKPPWLGKQFENLTVF